MLSNYHGRLQLAITRVSSLTQSSEWGNIITYRKSLPMRIIAFILCCLVLSACRADGSAHSDNRQPSTWSTDVIGISEIHLSAKYWDNRIKNADQVIKDQRGISEFNTALFSTDENMVELSFLPEQMPGDEVKARIMAISTMAKALTRIIEPYCKEN